MIELSLGMYMLLFFLIFLAGFVDSIAGGGGLISLTSYYAVGLPPIYALGNNKFSSTFGTLFALGVYRNNHSVNFRVGLFTAVFAFFGSLIGSNLAIRYSDLYLRYILVFTLPVIAIITLKAPKKQKESLLSGAKLYVLCALLGFFVGMYDGFFGPGTGLFLTLAFTGIAGFSLLDSCGNTKVVNLSSNIAALVSFIINGNIIYKIAVPCLFASILGNICGSTTAVKGGGRIVKPMLVVVLALLFIKLIVDFIH
jgi:Predicted permeases